MKVGWLGRDSTSTWLSGKFAEFVTVERGAGRLSVMAQHLGDRGVGLIEAKASRAVQLDPDVAPTSLLGGDRVEAEPQNGSRTTPSKGQNARISGSKAAVGFCVGVQRVSRARKIVVIGPPFVIA